MQENIIIAGHSISDEAPASWQRQLSRAIRDPQTLCQRLGLDAQWQQEAQAGHRLFDICVPEAYLSRIAPNDPSDPLLRRSCRWPKKPCRRLAMSPTHWKKPSTARPKA